MTENQPAMSEEAFTARLNELIPDGQEVYSLEVLVAHVNRRDSLISTLEANNDRLRAENERLTRQLDRCDCEKCFRCKDVIPQGNAIYYDSDGDPFCSRCWAALGRVALNPEPPS